MQFVLRRAWAIEACDLLVQDAKKRAFHIAFDDDDSNTKAVAVDPVPAAKKKKNSGRRGEMKCLGCMKFLPCNAFATDQRCLIISCLGLSDKLGWVLAMLGLLCFLSPR